MLPWAQPFSPGGAIMHIDHLADIADHFDAMLIDQFGVLHDGQKLYDGTLKTLAMLHARQIPVVVMTNSGKRASLNTARLLQMGIPRHYFVGAVSSGEMAFQGLGRVKAFVIGKTGEDYGFEGMTIVSTPGDADIILVLGSDAPRTSLADYETLLRPLTLPMICCNPDHWMLTAEGLQPAPGAISKLYEGWGGKVQWIGKPYPEIYHSALKTLQNPKRVLCVGDSAEHDIAGGKAAGLKTLLVMTGVSQGKNIAEIRPQPDYWMEDFA